MVVKSFDMPLRFIGGGSSQPNLGADGICKGRITPITDDTALFRFGAKFAGAGVDQGDGLFYIGTPFPFKAWAEDWGLSSNPWGAGVLTDSSAGFDEHSHTGAYWSGDDSANPASGGLLLGGLPKGAGRREASGTASILSGATSVVVTHGLPAAPAADLINLTITANPTNDAGLLYVTSITATQFTINCRADPGASNLAVAWRAACSQATGGYIGANTPWAWAAGDQLFGWGVIERR